MKKATTTIDWNYLEQHNWCFDTAMSQSPINIDETKAELMEDVGEIILDYSTTVDEIIDTGYAIQGNVTGKATINGRIFHLQQFHFHAHSEHTINNTHFPLELHFVHQAQSGKVAVIGILFMLGKENDVFNQIIEIMEEKSTDHFVDLEKLFPENHTFYHYLGSLTTPPLTENVEWYVMPDLIEISEKQLAQITKWYDHNHRTIQPLHNRHILKKEFDN
ncbi:carbonic anhydrase family protein [Vagococcus vulneris]|uniref:Carbonic anhydrase n=1 Tax=Vagococcus vulneris TaxID=1977869 RepID=A0A429ZX48_9ENTE|nr:carbonic anhydrase family protein [Vagococcus vulneris]RST98395.1 hypothetical protein CBF37_07735 [Vagococcus vulneris]